MGRGCEKTKPIKANCIFHRVERRARRAKQEIQSTSYFSAIFALSAVNKKTSLSLQLRSELALSLSNGAGSERSRMEPILWKGKIHNKV
jgi:hypothetical protein